MTGPAVVGAILGPEPEVPGRQLPGGRRRRRPTVAGPVRWRILRAAHADRRGERPRHDPDQPLLREGALGARPGGGRLHRAGPRPVRPPLRGPAGRGGDDGARARLRRRRARRLVGHPPLRGRRTLRPTAGSTRTIRRPPAEIGELEREFNDRLGPHGRRWMYHELRRRSDLASRYGTRGVPRFERVMLPVLYPAVYAWIDHHLEITPETARASIDEVRVVFDAVAERLADGRAYLCGDGFTAADLTFAALSAAVVMPPGYGVELPPPAELPPAAAEVVHELRAHPAGVYALGLYRDERR